MPEWQQISLKPRIKELQFWFKLREMGRWLAIQKITPVKKILESEFKKTVMQEVVTIPSLVFPGIITDRETQSKNETKQVSSGNTEGVLVQDLDKIKSNPKTILYTKQLSPDLAVYLPHLAGIISRRGGYLSHLSILAREAKVPVLVGVDLTKTELQIGDLIQIQDGNFKIKKS